MITEDYVSFEIAKLLEEKGFDCECHGYFWIAKDGDAILDYSYSEMDSNADRLYYSAPTLQMAMKWLREIHNLYISIEPNHDKEGLHNAHVRRNWWGHNWDGIGYKTYEEACEAAIKYCLENLI